MMSLRSARWYVARVTLVFRRGGLLGSARLFLAAASSAFRGQGLCVIYHCFYHLGHGGHRINDVANDLLG